MCRWETVQLPVEGEAGLVNEWCIRGANMWPDNRILDLFGIELPIIQAPMAGSALSDMVVAVAQAGGLGSLACALLSVEQARKELETIRQKTARPINANFFCHQPPPDDRA